MKKIQHESKETIRSYLNSEIDRMIRNFEVARNGDMLLTQEQIFALDCFAIENQIDLLFAVNNEPWIDRTTDPGFRIAHILELDRMYRFLKKEAECDKLFDKVLGKIESEPISDSLSIEQDTETVAPSQYERTKAA